MKKLTLLVKTILLSIISLFLGTFVYAGLTPLAAPGDTMFTLADIYVKLQTSGTSASYGLNPSTFPSVTMFTLTQLYNATPDFNNSPGTAVAGDVCNSGTFYNNSSTKVSGTRTGCSASGFPDTGQTTCYNMTTSTECGTSLFSDQDADYTINAPSYSTLSSVTVTDNNTGLEWQRHGHGASDGTTPPTALENCAVGATFVSGTPNTCTYNWQNALKYCSNLTLDGKTDWRIPNIKELVSIVHYGVANPSINTTYFLNTASELYWSSTTYYFPPSYTSSWNINFDYGLAGIVAKTNSTEVRLRCVRGGT